MGDYTSRIDIGRPAEEVFAFVSDIRNMPRYLPTVRGAAPQQGERVMVEGEANGRAYRSDGWFKVDPAARSMSWGSDGETDYHGEMRVAGADGRARVELRVHLNPRPDLERNLQAQTGDAGASVQEGLDAALRSIKAECEGTGGKQPTSADDGRGTAAATATAGDETTGATPRFSGPEAKPGDDAMLRDSRPFGHSATMNPDL